MRFVVMADATLKTGMGHVSRCLNIAYSLRQIDPAVRIVFTGDIVLSLQDRIRQDGFDVEDDASVSTGDIILHDRYGLDQPAVDCLLTEGARVVFVDDFGLLDLSSAHAVLNFRVGAEDMFRYGSQNDLLGVEYFPVPAGLKDVRKKKAAKGIATPAARLLIFMGGGSLMRTERAVVSAARAAAPDARIRLLSSHQFDESTDHSIEISAPSGPISPHLHWASAVLCGGGLLKYEAGYSGLPVACYSQTEGQQEDTASLVGRGLTHDLGLASQTPASDLIERLQTFMDYKVQAGLHNACLETYPTNSDRTLAFALLSL